MGRRREEVERHTLGKASEVWMVLDVEYYALWIEDKRSDMGTVMCSRILHMACMEKNVKHRCFTATVLHTVC